MEACTGKGDQPLPDLAGTHRSLFSGGCAQWCRSKPPAGYPQHPGWRWSRRAAARTAHETLWPRFCHTCLIRQLAENSPRSEIRKQVFSWGIKDNCLQQMHCLFVLLWVSCHAFFFYLSLSLSLKPNSLSLGYSLVVKITCLQWEYSEITSNTVCDVQANQSMQKKTAVRCRCRVCTGETTLLHSFLLLSNPEAKGGGECERSRGAPERGPLQNSGPPEAWHLDIGQR